MGQFVASGPVLLAALVAVFVGMVSFFSPCCLPLLPGFLSYITGMVGLEVGESSASAVPAPARPGSDAQGAQPASMARLGVATIPATPRTSRAVLAALLFVSGFAAVFTLYGAIFGALGTVLITRADTLTRALGVVTILLGLLFLGAFERIPWTTRSWRPRSRTRAGLVGAPLVGAMFGIGWTPCIGPTLAVVLGLSLQSGTAARGAFLAFAYSLGIGIPFVVAAVAMSHGVRRFDFPRRHARAMVRCGGLLLIVIGVLEVTGAWSELMTSLRVWASNYQAPL